MRGTCWFGLQGGFHHAIHDGSRVRGLASPPRCDLPDTANALLTGATAPEGHRSPMDVELCGDLSILPRPSGSLNNPRPQDYLLWCRTSLNPLLETGDFCLGEDNGNALA